MLGVLEPEGFDFVVVPLEVEEEITTMEEIDKVPKDRDLKCRHIVKAHRTTKRGRGGGR